MRPLLPALALVLALAFAPGCAGDPRPNPPAPSRSAGRGPTGPEPSPGPTGAQIVEASEVGLLQAYVVRDGARLEVTADGPPRPAGAGRYASCATVAGGLDLCSDSRDGPVARWTGDDGGAWRRSPVELAGLLTWPAASLRPGTFAIAGGGDGATLFPFQRVVGSSDAGATWQVFDVPLERGERAYSSGQVVLADGRLLALLDSWSGDRRGRPSDRHHGLHVSRGADWSAYRPHRPRFSPPLSDAPGVWSGLESLQASVAPDPVIWVTTWDDRLYVSTDDAGSFEQVPTR